MRVGRLNIRSSRRSRPDAISGRRSGCQIMNKVKGSTAIIYSRIKMQLRPATNRWFAERYNVNNAWIFNAGNGNLNNNNVNNSNRCQAVAILPVSS